ncbi:unnamed protein product [Scytosiphon promiscuus]
MAPPQVINGPIRQDGGAGAYTTESKRMRLSGSAKSAAAAAAAAAAVPAGSFTTTRASTGAPTAMTNKGSVYKAQRGRAVTAAAAVKAKAPTTHRRRGRRGKSVYRGVCVTREGKWRAVIYKERKQLYLGVYESEVDAAKAHDRAARFHFADSAVCNFDSEHEADRQAAIHKQRQFVQQQQLAEDREHHAQQLHGGSFSVGREEFDDLEEYHRGMDEAATSSSEDGGMMGDEEEEDDGLDGEEPLSHDGDHEIDEGGGDEDGLDRQRQHHNRRREECDMSEEGGDGYGDDGDEEDQPTRAVSSPFTSSAMSTGSMSDGGGNGNVNANGARVAHVSGGGHRLGLGHNRSRSAGHNKSYRVELTAPARAAVAAAFASATAVLPMATGGIIGNGVSDHQHQQRSRCSSGESDCSSDFVTPSALLREESMSSSTQEGMGFPVAEDLLGYEMQSWYCCQDDEERSPASSSGGASFGSSQLQQQQPFMGRQQQQQQQQQQSEELWGTAVGANLGWGFGDFAQTYSDGGSRTSSGSMSSSLSCDDEYVPSALPPLMGISSGEA